MFFSLIHLVTSSLFAFIVLSNFPGLAFADKPKNIIYIMLDDADFSDFGYNNDLLEEPDAITPNIDALRSGGKLFRNFYSGSSICSPTRISVLTGNMPLRFGAIDAWPTLFSFVHDKGFRLPTTNTSTILERQRQTGMGGIAANIPQIGKLMKGLGKVTGHFGKWHVGFSRENYRHKNLGFDYFGIAATAKRTALAQWNGEFRFLTESGAHFKKVPYLDIEYTNMTLNFVDKFHDSEDGFFLNFWPVTPHFPWTPPSNYDNSATNFDLKTRRGKLLAMMFTIDQQVGRIVKRLKHHGILDETLIILTSDNGGQGRVRNSNPYLRGAKGNLLEGGIRVSMVANWPNGIERNTSNDTVMTTFDIMPTLLDMIGYNKISSLEAQIDGRSKKHAMISDKVLMHDPIIWEISGSGKRKQENNATRSYSIRDGKFSLIKLEGRDPRSHKNPYYLFDHTSDARGKTNIAKKMPEIVTILSQKMLEMRKRLARFQGIPEYVETPTEIAFSPQLDTADKDMTLSMNLDIQHNDIDTHIVSRKGSFSVYLTKDLRISWQIEGVTKDGSKQTIRLMTEPLERGQHQIQLSIMGFKRDFSKMQIFVDGETAADGDSVQKNTPIDQKLRAIWSTVSPLKLGAKNSQLRNIKYYNAILWPHELEIAAK